MFEKLKQLQERKEQEEQAEQERLQALSEKELMIEMLMELKRISWKCDDIRRKIVTWSN